MKNLIILAVLVFVVSGLYTHTAEAKTSYSYRSAKTGRYTTKSYSTSHPNTTYRSRR